MIHRPRRAGETDFLVFTVCSENLDENTLGRKFSPAQGGHMHKPGNILLYGRRDNQYFMLLFHIVLKYSTTQPSGARSHWELSKFLTPRNQV